MTTTPAPTLLKVSAYAKRENISIRTVQRWISRDLITVVRVGPTQRVRVVVTDTPGTESR